MADRARADEPAAEGARRHTPDATNAPARVARSAAPAAAALALQRAAGNRAAARAIARWAAHPDKDKKGQFMTDGMAESWNRFNPPLSK